jgi:hypothetical protein
MILLLILLPFVRGAYPLFAKEGNIKEKAAT